MEVRRATAEDLSAIVRMAEAMHAESPRYRDMRFDPIKLRALATSLLRVPGTALFVAVDGEPIGLAAIVTTERWFGPDRYVTDLGIYLQPEHRGSGAFPMLVQAVEMWSHEQGVRDIDLGVSAGIDTAAAVRAYERMGYTVAETRVVTKTIDHVHRP